MRIIYFSRDYTTHDWRYLAKLSQTPHQIWYLRLEKGPVTLEKRPLPQGIRLVEWRGGQKPVEGLVNQLSLLPSLRKTLRQIKPDVLHAGPVQSCGFLSALTGFRPLVIMSWGSDLLVEADRGPLQRWITSFTLRRADVIVGDSQTVREKVHAFLHDAHDRVITYPWGIDLEMFQPKPSRLSFREQLGWQDKVVFLHTRSWESLYGIDTLLEAFLAIYGQRPNVRLLLIGDGSMAPKVHHFILQHGLSSTVYLAGQVPHEDSVDYFNLADLYVSCTLSDGTSISLLEAMACALPVVVTDIPGNREWIQHGTNGWLAKPGDASSLASALLQALDHLPQWGHIGQRNFAIARARADWNQNFQLLLDAYEKAAGARRAA